MLARKGYQFDLDTQNPEILLCKSFKKHLKRIGKETKKGLKKAKKVASKALKDVGDFVVEHKKECLIAAGLIALGVGLGAAISAGAFTAAAPPQLQEVKERKMSHPFQTIQARHPPTLLPPRTSSLQVCIRLLPLHLLFFHQGRP